MHTLLVISVLAVAVPDRQDLGNAAARPLEEDLIGQWQVVKRVTHGRDDGNLGGLHMLFKRESMQHLLNEGAQPATMFPFVLDTTKRPATIVFRGNEKGIISVEGDQMKLCIGSGGVMPTDFVSAPGSNVTLLELRRVRK